MARGRRLPEIKVLPPDVVPISTEDYQTAVTALAQMIGQWWNRQQHDQDPAPTADRSEPHHDRSRRHTGETLTSGS